MIYLDNAATTFPKPPEVEHAVMAAFHTIGNAGRGAHAATLDASRIIYGTRERLAELFHAEDASRIAFTANVTESLNIAIQGLFEPGDHVITSVCEHNSVLRPLYLMEQRGVKVTYLPADSKGRITYDELENAYEPETKAVVIMHASNLTGNVTDLEQIAAFTQKHHLLFVVDAVIKDYLVHREPEAFMCEKVWKSGRFSQEEPESKVTAEHSQKKCRLCLKREL